MPPRFRKRETPFQSQHEIEFGLQVVQRHPKLSTVVSVRCQFCRYFGKEEKAGAKRARTQIEKCFTAPFRPELYRSHVTGQHPEKWAQYSSFTDADKKDFFEKKVPFNNTLAAHFSGEGVLKFKVKKNIVTDLIGGLFFNEDDEDEAKSKALEMFEDVDESENTEVTIKSTRLFRLVTAFLANGASFRMASNLVASTRRETALAYYTGCTTLRCIRIARVICAANMARMSEVLSKVWAFSIAIDSGNKQGSNYLDIRVRFFWDHKLRNFHVAAVPIPDRKTSANLFDLCEKLLNALVRSW